MSGPANFRGWFRRLRARILHDDVQVVGQCKLCGVCCDNILLRDGNRWLRNEKQFRALCEEDSRFEGFVPTERDDYGHLAFTCSHLKDNICTSYEGRLPLCRNYPSKSIYYQGVDLRPDCGFSFKAVSFRDAYMRRKRGKMPSFSEVMRREKAKRRK